MKQWERWERASALTVFALIVATFIPAATFTWWTVTQSDVGETIAGTAGLSVVVFLSLPSRRWLLAASAIMFAEVLSGWMLGGTDDIGSMLGFGAASVAEGITAALIYNRLAGRTSGARQLPDLGRRRGLAYFALAACLAGPIVGAAVEVVTLMATSGSVDWALAGRHLVAHSVGVIIVAPLFLVWTAPEGERSWKSPVAIGFAVTLGVAAKATLAFSNMPVLFLLLAGLITAGAFFDARTIALSGASLTLAITISITMQPEELMTGTTPETSLTLTMIELLVFGLSAYLVAAQTNETMFAAKQAAMNRITVSQLQQLLLPPLEMHGSGYEVRGNYDPAQRRVGIGGDWYLARVATSGELVIAVGDIVGHDYAAARSMAAVRSGLALEAAINPDPKALLERLDAFSDAEPSIRYSTAWVGVYDPINRTLDYACAGHLPPLVVANDRVYRLDRANTALVGIPQGRRTSTTTFVPPGAAIVLYTDGLVERRTTGLEAGIDRLESAILRVGADPDALLDVMLADSPRDDDSAVAAISFDQVEDDPEHADERLKPPRAVASTTLEPHLAGRARTRKPVS